MMKTIATFIKLLSRTMNWIAGFALVSMVLLVVTDVVLRRFSRPIDFTFEIVVLLAAVVISFSLPQATFDSAHVVTDFFIEKLPKRWREALFAMTRIMAVFIFALFAWKVAGLATKFSKAGQSSPILELPEYVVTYAVAVCCFVECFVLIVDLFENINGGGRT